MHWRHHPLLDHQHGEFTPPPRTVVDALGRYMDFRLYGNGPVDDEYEALVGMYLDFAPEHRSLGLPPITESRIREWVDVLVAGDSALAWDEARVAGQATLLESGESECEMSIFLHQAYQGAGIGTFLTETLLGHAKQQGVGRVWVLVERANYRAVNLYRDVGFSVTENHGADVEMAIDLGNGTVRSSRRIPSE